MKTCIPLFFLIGTLSIHGTVVDQKMQIYKTDQPPQIDGLMDGVWKQAGHELMLNYAQDFGTAPDNWLDCFARVYTLYDADGLYVYLSVQDETVLGEEVEIYLDGDNSKNDAATGYDFNDIQVRWRKNSGGDGPVNSQYAFRDTDNGFDFELHWAAADLPFQCVDNQEIGLEFQINDADGGQAEHKLLWWGDSNESWRDPSTFGTAEIKPESQRLISDKLDINYKQGAPVIDGNRDAYWEGLPEIRQNFITDETNISHLSGWNDLCFKAWQAWNENALYFFVQVDDDVINTSDPDGYDQDAVELFFDGDNSKNTVMQGYDANDVQIRWGVNGQTTGFPNSSAAFQIVEGGYQFELAVPSQDLPFDLSLETVFGFEIRVLDDDDGTGSRDASAQWWSHSNETWHDPSTFGEARLVHLNAEQVSPLTFYPLPGTYYDELDVQIATATDNAVIHYTVDGTEPGQSSPIAVNGQVHLSQSGPLRARAYYPALPPSQRKDGQYTFQVAQPSFNPPAGLFGGSQVIQIQSTSPDAVFYYTTDGTEPSQSSMLYVNGVTVNVSTTLKVRGYRSGWQASDIQEGVFYITEPTVDRPLITPEPGIYTARQTIELECATPGADIYYTVDGTQPTQQTARYTAPFRISRSTVIRAAAFVNGWKESLILTAQYSISDTSDEGRILKAIAPTDEMKLVLIQNIAIPESDLNVGDEVGIFARNLCVGSGRYTGGWPMAVEMWFSESLDEAGAMAGDSLSFKIWSAELNAVMEAEADYGQGAGAGIAGEPLTLLSQLTALTDTISPFVTGPVTGIEGSPVAVNASYSYIPAGTAVLYKWDIDGDGSADVSSAGPDTVLIFSDDGWFEAGLEIVDSRGGSASTDFLVQIHNAAPEIHPVSDLSLQEGDTLSIDSISFEDPAMAAESYTLEVNWGDGSTVETAVGLTRPPMLQGEHVYTDNGRYSVQLKLDDGDGGEAFCDYKVNVFNVAPVLTELPDQIAMKDAAWSLEGLYVKDPAGASDDYSGRAYWGDGAITPVSVGSYADSARVTASHAYADSGLYPVSVLLWDDDGGMDTSTFQIQVFSEDFSPPVLILSSIGANACHVPVNMPLTLRLTDNYYGIDPVSLSIAFNQRKLIENGLNRLPDELDVTPIDRGFEIHWPAPDWETETNYELHIACQDQALQPSALDTVIAFQTGRASLTEQHAEIVTAAGGTVGGANQIQLMIPPLAVSDDREFSIFSTTLPLSLPDTAKDAGRVCFLSPDDLAFEKNITVRIPFYMGNLNERGIFDRNLLRLYRLSIHSEGWETVDIDTVLNNYLTFGTRHFSYYALAAWQPAMPATDSKAWISVFNYPNPFSDETFIQVESLRDETVSLIVFDVNGRKVKTLKQKAMLSAGVRREFNWNGLNGAGNRVANHVYYLVIENEDGRKIYHKIAVLK